MDHKQPMIGYDRKSNAVCVYCYCLGHSSNTLTDSFRVGNPCKFVRFSIRNFQFQSGSRCKRSDHQSGYSVCHFTAVRPRWRRTQMKNPAKNPLNNWANIRHTVKHRFVTCTRTQSASRPPCAEWLKSEWLKREWLKSDWLKSDWTHSLRMEVIPTRILQCSVCSRPRSCLHFIFSLLLQNFSFGDFLGIWWAFMAITLTNSLDDRQCVPKRSLYFGIQRAEINRISK